MTPLSAFNFNHSNNYGRQRLKSRLGMVYSTDPAQLRNDDEPEVETLTQGQQDLRVWLDRKQRAGKALTLVKKALWAEMPTSGAGAHAETRRGVGGLAKAGEIIIQGDHRDRVAELLIRSGYRRAGS